MINCALMTIFHVYARELPAKQMPYVEYIPLDCRINITLSSPQISNIVRQLGISVAIEVHTK